MRDYFNSTAPVRFVYPIDGDCMNIYDGVIKDGYLTITVKVAAPADAELYIDEQKAPFDGEYFTKEVPLKTYRTTITAEDRKTAQRLQSQYISWRIVWGSIVFPWMIIFFFWRT